MSNNQKRDEFEKWKFQYDKLLQSTYQDSSIAYVLFTLFFGFAAGMFVITANMELIVETIALVLSIIMIISCVYIVDRFLIAGDIRRKAMVNLESKMQIYNFKLFEKPESIKEYDDKSFDESLKIATFDKFFKRWIFVRNDSCYKASINKDFIENYKKKQLRVSEAIYLISTILILSFLAHTDLRYIFILFENIDLNYIIVLNTTIEKPWWIYIYLFFLIILNLVVILGTCKILKKLYQGDSNDGGKDRKDN